MSCSNNSVLPGILVNTSGYFANISLTSFFCSSVSLSEILTSQYVSTSFLEGNVQSSRNYPSVSSSSSSLNEALASADNKQCDISVYCST